MKFSTGMFNDAFFPILDGVVNTIYNYADLLNKKYGRSYVIAPSSPGYTDNVKFPVLRYFSLPLPTRYP